MSAYEIGAEVIVDRLHQRGTISGAGAVDYGSSTGNVYVVDLPGNDTQLVYEEDLTFPDVLHEVEVLVMVRARIEAETLPIARARLIENLEPRVHQVASDMTEEDRHEEMAYLKIEVVR